jgi:hypothetical protein
MDGFMNDAKEIQCAPVVQYRFECFDKNGKQKWKETFRNTVMTVGKNYLLNNIFQTGTYTQAFYIGIMGTGTIGAPDTMASHNWNETTAYSGTNRPGLSFSAAAGGTSTCTALSYSMTGTYTANGAFITTNQPVSGTSGTLYSAGTFATQRTGGNGDTINVTPTLILS